MVVPTFTAAMTVAMAAPVCCALGAMCAFAYTMWRHREAAITVGGPPAQAFGPSEGVRHVLQALERRVDAEEGALRWAEEKMRLVEQFASSIRRRPSLQAALVADPEGAARRERQEYERTVRPQRAGGAPAAQPTGFGVWVQRRHGVRAGCGGLRRGAARRSARGGAGGGRVGVSPPPDARRLQHQLICSAQSLTCFVWVSMPCRIRAPVAARPAPV